jgi:hypothetical protein
VLPAFRVGLREQILGDDVGLVLSSRAVWELDSVLPSVKQGVLVVQSNGIPILALRTLDCSCSNSIVTTIREQQFGVEVSIKRIWGTVILQESAFLAISVHRFVVCRFAIFCLLCQVFKEEAATGNHIW